MVTALETTETVLLWVGIVEVLFLIVVIATSVVLWFRGIIPVLYRLGNGLARRTVAILASSGIQPSLKALLEDSRLFRKKNILAVTGVQDIDRAEEATVLIVYWPDWSDQIDRVLSMKRDQTALIVHAPPDGERIPDGVMAKLNERRNVVVNNFRGRLLTDVVSSLITTSYEKR